VPGSGDQPGRMTAMTPEEAKKLWAANDLHAIQSAGSTYYGDRTCPVGETFVDEEFGETVIRILDSDVPFPCGKQCCGIEFSAYIVIYDD
jgi:hypothetical protein